MIARSPRLCRESRVSVSPVFTNSDTSGSRTEANLFRQVLRSALLHPRASPGEAVTVSLPRTAALAGSLAVVAALALSACGAAPDNASTTADGKNAATATSAADFGGLDALVKAAKKEGTLQRHRAAPRLGQLRRPHRRLREEVRHQDRGREPGRLQPGRDQRRHLAQGPGPRARRPRPRQLLRAQRRPAGPARARTRWPPSPTSRPGRRTRRPAGTTTTAATSPSAATPSGSRPARPPSPICSSPQYKGQVALNGNPTKSGSAFGGVYAAALANGGSFDDIQPGLDFFAKLKKNGNYTPVESTPATVEKGETPISIDWDYLNAGYADEFKSKGVDWKVSVPERRPVRAVLLPGHQQGRPAPGGRPPVAGVPLQHRGPEPVAQGVRPPGADDRHGEGRHPRQDRRGQAPEGLRHAVLPDRGPAGQGQDGPRRQAGRKAVSG